MPNDYEIQLIRQGDHGNDSVAEGVIALSNTLSDQLAGHDVEDCWSAIINAAVALLEFIDPTNREKMVRDLPDFIRTGLAARRQHRSHVTGNS